MHPPRPKVARQLSVLRAVHPTLLPREVAMDNLKERGIVRTDDNIVLVSEHGGIMPAYA